MAIKSTEVRGLFTKYLVEKLEIVPEPTLFLKSFFKEKKTSSKNVSIEVMRHGEPIAADVMRGGEGNMNRWDTSSEKIWTPPFFDERFLLNELDGYDRIFGGMQEVQEDQFMMVLDKAAAKVALLKNKINRAYELQTAKVLQTGIVTMVNGDNIDFRRSAASKGVLSGGSQWTDDVDPDTVLKEGAEFIRTQGLYGGGEFNVIFGSGAWDAYINNTQKQAKSDIKDFKLSDISSPLQFGNGSSLLGRTSVGAYSFNLWGYPQFYNPAGTDKTGKVPYVASNQIIILPNDYSFTFAYAGVPHVMRNAANAEYPEYISYSPADFVIDNYLDKRHANHEFSVKSAGLPIPTQVDAIFNKQVIA